MLTTLGAQPVFLLFPVAPPRTLDDFVDTIAEVSGFDIDRGLVAELYDPIAAMPSIHVAFAVVTAAGLADAAALAVGPRRGARRTRRSSRSIVFVTGNHYVLDAVGGGALAAPGCAWRAPCPDRPCPREGGDVSRPAQATRPAHLCATDDLLERGALLVLEEVEHGLLDLALEDRLAELLDVAEVRRARRRS